MFDALFTTTTEYKKLSHALSGKGACALFGLPASGRAQVYAALCRQFDKPLCIVTPGEAEATRFAADLNTLGIPAAVFPARDYVLRPIEGTAREYEYRRLAVLGELVGGRLRAVAVPAEALTQFTTPKEDFCANTRTLHAGDTLLRDDLLAALFGAGYTRRAQVDGPGQFSVRGDIVDIFAPDQKMPVRMEFWGDEIDTLHTFDLTTQRREDAIDKFYLSPRGKFCSASLPMPPSSFGPFWPSSAAKRKPPWQTVWPPIWTCWMAVPCRSTWTNTWPCATPIPPPCWIILTTRSLWPKSLLPSGKPTARPPTAGARN